MDSIVGDDPTLPLDFSYSADMYLADSRENVDARSRDNAPPIEDARKIDPSSSSSTSGTNFASGHISPGGNRNMKDYATQISELKKENFSLKLRIYYMEERMMEQISGDHDQLWKKNIELKVECDGLRRELGEKHDLLVKASNAVACLEAANPDEVRRLKMETEREVEQVRELMNEKVANAEKELQIAHHDSEQAVEQALKLKKELIDVQKQNENLENALLRANAALENAEAKPTVHESSTCTDLFPLNQSVGSGELEAKIAELENELEERNETIAQLQKSLASEKASIKALNEEKEAIQSEQVQPLANDVKHLTEKLQTAESALNNAAMSDEKAQQRYQDHITEQQQRLDDFELATKQMAEELDKRETEVKDLKDALKEAEETLQNLSSKPQSGTSPEEREKILKDINKRDRAIAGLTQIARKKDDEIAALVVELNDLKLEVETLKLCNEEKESKIEALMLDLQTNRSKIESSPSKESLLTELREQLKVSDEALQTLKGQAKESDEFFPLVKESLSERDSLPVQRKAQLRDASLQTEYSTNSDSFVLREQLLVSESAMQQLQRRNRQLQDKLQEVDATLQDALDEKSRSEDEHEKYVRELNLKAREQNRLIERLRSQIADHEETIGTLEESIKEKDWQFQELNTKHKKLLKELQEAFDDKAHTEDEHEKYVREQEQKNREEHRQIERLKSQVGDYEETVASLDSKVKEKDWQLQELVTKHKNLLKELQEKEEERLRAVLERDELMSQCEEEKNRFSTLANQVLRRSASEVSSSSLIEVEALSRVRKLEDELFKKNQALTDAILARDKAAQEHAAASRELEHALARREREKSGSDQEISLRDVEIRRLKDLLRDSEDKLHDYENEMRSEVNKLMRQNSELREKLQTSEDELVAFKTGSFNKRPASKTSVPNKPVSEDLLDLRRELARKDEEIRKLRSQKQRAEEDIMSSSKTSRNVTFNNSGRRLSPKKKSGYLESSSSYDVSEDDVTLTDESASDRDSRHYRRLKQVHVQNRKNNMTIDTTFGLPLDQTSYMSIADGYHGDDDADGYDIAVQSVPKLKNALSNTRLQLSDAVRELTQLKQDAAENAEKIKLLEKMLEEKTEESKSLAEKFKKTNQERLAKESEVLGLLARLRDSSKRASAKRHRVDMDALKSDSATESDSALLSARSRRRSGDESDGMSSLSRKELCEAINHLKKKLDNAEKVNDLLKNQISNPREDKTPAVNPQLVAELTSEVKRLKSELEAQQLEKEKERHISPSRSAVNALPSKLPVPKNNKGPSKTQNPLKPELERARMLNRKLNERVAATEQTVRMQAEKLAKCRAALREAGIASPPISPMRTARSAPNLYDAPDAFSAITETRRQRSHSVSSDTNEAGTQTAPRDNDDRSLSPKSEQRFNSLIQSQAKELSLLREQLEKSRNACKQLQTEMDITSRYVKALLNSDVPDQSIITAVDEEMRKSKKLVAKLRKSLAENLEVGHSDEESDFSAVDSPLSLSASETHQLERLKKEVTLKNDEISKLKEDIKTLKDAMQERLTTDSLLLADKWSSTPNLHPYFSHAMSPHERISSPRKKPSSVGSPCHARSDRGVLTPASSHLSLYSASEDEMRLLNGDSPTVHSRLTDDLDNYAKLPNALEKTGRSSWPAGYDHVTGNESKRRPMYQRTIAVTEYLPPNTTSDRGRSFSAVSVGDKSPLHHRSIPTSDASRCSASYGGRWASPSGTPQKSRDDSRNKQSPFESTRLPVGDSSCDEIVGDTSHKLSREVDRLRRRLTDSKRINRSLKEELDLANKTLLHSRNSSMSGYGRSAHPNTELLAEHLSEIRALRQRLEQSIATNDRLRDKLEKRLQDATRGSREHLSANIYLAANHDQTSPATDILKLEKRIEQLKVENEKLRQRLKEEERAHSSYEDAVKEMKSMQQVLAEKANQIDRLTDRLQQLQYELKEQTALSENLEEKLRNRDRDISEYKQKIELLESEKEKLVGESEKTKDDSKNLWNELQSCKNQLKDSQQLVDSLKSELGLYEKLQEENNKSAYVSAPSDFTELLQEIRSLRIQLERSIEDNAALRKQLEEQLANPASREERSHTTINIHHLSPHSSSNSLSPTNRPSPRSARRKLKLATTVNSENVLMTPPASASSGGEDHDFNFTPLETSNGHIKTIDHAPLDHSNDKKPFYCRGGPYTLCKSDDFLKLQQTVAKSGLVARSTDNKITDALKNVLQPNSPEKRVFKEAWKSTKSLCRLLDDGDELLRLFWPVVIPFSLNGNHDDYRGRSYSSSGVATGGHCSSVPTPTLTKQISDSDCSVASETDGLRREVGRLRRRLTTQDRLLQSTVERLHNTNKLKEGIEHAIVKQLSRTHDVLRKARGNLEAQAQGSGQHAYSDV